MREFNQNTLLADNELHFDCMHCYEFAEGKILVCYEKTHKLLVVEYRYESFQSTHFSLIKLSELTKSWCVIDQSIEHFLNIHLSLSKKEEVEQIKTNLWIWKVKVKAEVLMLAYNYYFTSKKQGGLLSEMRLN